MIEEGKLYCVKTDKGCFISDILYPNSYEQNYHRSIVPDLKFNDEFAKESYAKHWYFVNKFPEKIFKKLPDKRIQERYEIKNKSLVSNSLKSSYLKEEFPYTDDDSVYSLYTYAYDTVEGDWEEYDIPFEVILEVDNFTMPIPFNYKKTEYINFKDTEIIVDRYSIEYSLLHKMIVPDVMLHQVPCSISSKDLYGIVRQYIKENIDLSVAKITSDYDFCFTVKKIVPLYKEKKISYQNIFAKTKKQRNKINTKTIEYDYYEIFEMTHDRKNYGGYSVLQGISANNEYELKEKIDFFLKKLIEHINKKLVPCEHCEGTGYIDFDKKNLQFKTKETLEQL